MKTILQRGLVAFLATAAACLFLMATVDRPVARFFGRHIGHSVLLEIPLHLILIVMPVTGFCLLWCGANVSRKRPLPPLVGMLGIAGFAVFLSLGVTEFLLKPFFSRYDVNDYFWSGHYGFRWFGGIITSSFPSGHTAILASFLSVLWLICPKGRPVYAVRRQNIWHSIWAGLVEHRPRLGVDVKRRACGVASVDVRWSVA